MKGMGVWVVLLAVALPARAELLPEFVPRPPVVVVGASLKGNSLDITGPGTDGLTVSMSNGFAPSPYLSRHR